MKKIISTIIAITLLCNFGFSQDIIQLKSGIEIKAKVIEVGVKEIKYKKFDFQEGPDYIVRKNDIELIKYENNKVDIFYRNKKMKPKDYKALYTKKINHYKKQRKIGLYAIGAGIIGTTILYVNYENWENPTSSRVISDTEMNYFFGFVIGTGITVAGTVLNLTGNRKVKEYSEKLKNVSVGVNLSSKQKGISLVYRF